jgi:hypothetical protein
MLGCSNLQKVALGIIPHGPQGSALCSVPMGIQPTLILIVDAESRSVQRHEKSQSTLVQWD